MVVHRRPRGGDVTLFEDFERFLIDIASKIPVMVTVECVPGFQSFDGRVSNLFYLVIFDSSLLFYLLMLI